jgi:uncharacterized membrane protein YfcA
MVNEALFGTSSIWIVVLCVSAAAAAGYLDAVAGGGGLVQLPALLIALPSSSLATIYGTNKFSAVFGTAAAARTYFKSGQLKIQLATWMVLLAGIGSYSGARLASVFNRAQIEPAVSVLLIGVALFVLFKPQLGLGTASLNVDRSAQIKAGILGLVVGFYDGIIGPGTGTFLIFGLVLIVGANFLQASAVAKVVNVATNLAALAFFIPSGHIYWGLAIVMAMANLAGGILGARFAIKQGSSFIRYVYLAVVAVLLIRLATN